MSEPNVWAAAIEAAALEISAWSETGPTYEIAHEIILRHMGAGAASVPQEWRECLRELCQSIVGDARMMTNRQRDAVTRAESLIADTWTTDKVQARIDYFRRHLDSIADWRDAAGRPFPELLTVAADILRGYGGGPVEECLRLMAERLLAGGGTNG